LSFDFGENFPKIGYGDFGALLSRENCPASLTPFHSLRIGNAGGQLV
jgi:hypothetical protein